MPKFAVEVDDSRPGVDPEIARLAALTRSPTIVVALLRPRSSAFAFPPSTPR